MLPILHVAIEPNWGIIKSKLLLNFEAVAWPNFRVGRVGRAGGTGRILDLLPTAVLVQIDLAGGLGKGFERAPSLWQIMELGGRGTQTSGAVVPVALGGGSLGAGDAVELEARTHAVRLGNGGTFLGDVGSQAINATFGEVLPALLAGVGVAVAIVVEFRPAYKVFEDEGIRLATHCAREVRRPGPSA